ncbi:MAG: GH3 auxin-responsive promoter family protein [Bacteroidia bacterium]|nr:GH3 auxin-responsive promoter family protein [Bacteroidia bacterium]
MKSTIINSFLAWYFKSRLPQVEFSLKNPAETQYNIFNDLIYKGSRTEFGRLHDFINIHSVEDFQSKVPLQNYDSLKPYIKRMLNGEQFLLWPSEITWFAKSSGTTTDKSKFIPVSFEALEDCQYKGGRDVLTFYCSKFQNTKIFEGKSLMIGGSHEINPLSENMYYGDLSAVMMNNLPFWVNLISTPTQEIALMANWEEKLEKIARHTLNEDVTSISGVPTWTLLLFKRLLEITGKSSMLDVWPNLELYIHGGVNFAPYREQFKNLIPSESMNYIETYNASEGFFGIQESPRSEGMLLMVDYGIFYEFIPLGELEKENPKALLLDEIEVGVNYALAITTNAGLWRYLIGDTVKFIDNNPYKFIITGRTKLFINTFGEELMIENAEAAITMACVETNSEVREFTAGPIYFKDDEPGGHEWIIEFYKHPENIDIFAQKLDTHLKNLNSDYEAKRTGNMAIAFPRIRTCKEGVFYNWLKEKGKLGGQNKVPRLSNDRKIIEEIYKYL